MREPSAAAAPQVIVSVEVTPDGHDLAQQRREADGRQLALRVDDRGVAVDGHLDVPAQRAGVGALALLELLRARHLVDLAAVTSWRITRSIFTRPLPARRTTARALASTVWPSTVAVRSISTSPSSRTALTSPPTRDDGLAGVGDDDRAGETHAVLDDRARVAGPVGDDPDRGGHRVHAVGDHVGQAEGLRVARVPVDRVEVARCAGVAHQVDALDREVLGRDLVADADRLGSLTCPAPSRRWSRRPSTTSSPSASAPRSAC